VINRRKLTIGVATVLILTAGSVALTNSTVSASSDPAALLIAARQSRVSFNAEVEIRWRSGGSVKSKQLQAQSDRGRYWIGDSEWGAGGDSDSRWVTNNGVTTEWSLNSENAWPSPSAKWNLVTINSGVKKSGLVVDFIDVLDQSGRRRARIGIDRVSGMEVSEDVFSASGSLVHSVHLNLLTTAELTPVTIPTRKVETGDKDAPSGEFASPRRLGQGFELVARYRFADGISQSFYSDGIFTLSVFEQSESIDWSALPKDGKSVDLGDATGRRYSTPSGTVVVWSDGNRGFTGISDAPPDVAVAALRPMSPRSLSAAEKIADFVTAPFDWN